MIYTCATHYSYLVRVSHLDLNDPNWRAMMTHPILFAHVFIALHTILMSEIGLWGIHQGGSIKLTE